MIPALSLVNEKCERKVEDKERMDETFKDFKEAEEAGDLVQDVYTYLTDHQYPPDCVQTHKRAIRR